MGSWNDEPFPVLHSQPARGLGYFLCCWNPGMNSDSPRHTGFRALRGSYKPHTHTHDPHFSTCDSDVAYGRSSGQGTQGTTLLSLFSICLFNRTMISFPARDTGDRVVHLSGTTIRTLHINAVRCSIHFYIRCKHSLFLKKATRYIWNRMIFRSDLFKSLHPHGLTMLSSDACNMQKMLEK